MEINNGKEPLPHHEQQPLCTSRLPYRQGRKLTAVKVYTIINESNHLLVFGVPSINIRQETKNLFIKFGKLLRFNLTKEYKTEKFTETYHVSYENIKSARIAKKYIDTKNFYGGTLHVCYAPELETLEETRKKLLLRKKEVLSRLKTIEMEKNQEIDQKINDEIVKNEIDLPTINTSSNKTLNMGYENIIYLNSNRKRKLNEYKTKKNMKKSTDNNKKLIHNDNEFSTSYNKPGTSQNESNVKHNLELHASNLIAKPKYYNNEFSITHSESSTGHNKTSTNQNEPSNEYNKSSINYEQPGASDLMAEPMYYYNESSTNHNKLSNNHYELSSNHNELSTKDDIEIIDFTSTERDTISNINEALNYNKFGNEVIKKIENKSLNRIKFNFNK